LVNPMTYGHAKALKPWWYLLLFIISFLIDLKSSITLALRLAL
jgi:hypothetical protein